MARRYLYAIAHDGYASAVEALPPSRSFALTFTPAEARRLARAAGYRPRKCWSDDFIGPFPPAEFESRLAASGKAKTVATALFFRLLMAGPNAAAVYFGGPQHAQLALAEMAKIKPRETHK